MPNVTISFSLPDEEPEFMSATNGHKYRRVLVDFTNHLRMKKKHPPDDISPLLLDEWESLYDYMYSLIWNEGLADDYL